jgi:hypothetical protein
MVDGAHKSDYFRRLVHRNECQQKKNASKVQSAQVHGAEEAVRPLLETHIQ